MAVSRNYCAGGLIALPSGELRIDGRQLQVSAPSSLTWASKSHEEALTRVRNPSQVRFPVAWFTAPHRVRSQKYLGVASVYARCWPPRLRGWALPKVLAQVLSVV